MILDGYCLAWGRCFFCYLDIRILLSIVVSGNYLIFGIISSAEDQ